MKLLHVLILVGLLGITVGCKTAPTALEKKFFDVQTNLTPVVTVFTNTVYWTNYQIVTVPVTNTLSTTNNIYVTNTVPVVVTSNVIERVTNLVEKYIFTPNTNAQTIAQTAGEVGALFGPFGTLGSLIVGGIFGLWGILRSSRASKTAAVLTQIIETASEILKKTPQGSQIDVLLKDWMMKHQAETGTIEAVMKILATYTDNQDAQNVANQILALVKTNPAPPTAPTPPA